MKRKTKFAAMALVFVLALSCCLVPALAQEDDTAAEGTVTEYTADEGTAAEDTADEGTAAGDTSEESAASIAERGDNANSWRYSNGEPIQQTAASTLSEGIATLSETTQYLSLTSQPSESTQALSQSSPYYTTWPTDIAGAVRYGIDVSKWQGNIDWAAAKAAGVEFAIIRCGYGSNSTDQDDPYWEINASTCEALGIPYGTYLYSYADTVEKAVSEAEHVLRLVEGHTLSYPIYYDLEDDTLADLSPSELAAIAQAFCSTIEAAGYTAGVYANLYWWTTKLTDPVFDQWPRWVAQWNTSCDYTGTYTMWQCSSSGVIDGISENTVDLNIDFGAALSAPVTVCTHDYVAGEQTDPTCTAEGSVPYTCSKCGASYTETIAAAGHVAGAAVTENDSVSGGSTGGSYDSVVYCTVCGEEVSRVTIDVSGSISASTSSVGAVVDVIEEPEIEEDTDASMGSNELAESNGAVDDMGSNAVNTVDDEASDNTASASPGSEGDVSLVGGDETADNAVSASPSSEGDENLAGSADSSGRAESNAVIDSTGCEHIASNAVTENGIDATCTEDGSYESVVYCTTCGTELSREAVAVSATGHQFLWVVAEEATATEDGSQYQQCVICGEVGSTAVLSAAAEEAESSKNGEADDGTSGDDAATAAYSEGAPATGDTTNATVWVISLLTSMAASVMVMVSYRRHIRREKQIAAIIERINRGR